MGSSGDALKFVRVIHKPHTRIACCRNEAMRINQSCSLFASTRKTFLRWSLFVGWSSLEQFGAVWSSSEQFGAVWSTSFAFMKVDASQNCLLFIIGMIFVGTVESLPVLF